MGYYEDWLEDDEEENQPTYEEAINNLKLVGYGEGIGLVIDDDAELGWLEYEDDGPYGRGEGKMGQEQGWEEEAIRQYAVMAAKGSEKARLVLLALIGLGL